MSQFASWQGGPYPMHQYPMTTEEAQSAPSDAYMLLASGGTTASDWSDHRARIFGGADVLFIRPTFSEAIAYAQGTQVFPVSMNIQSVPIEFDYDAAFRAFVGFRAHGAETSVVFTFTSISADTTNSGAVGGPGQFIVDPFGNLVGTVQVIDPSDARGVGTVLQQGPFVGDRIRTDTSLDLQAYDLMLETPASFSSPSLQWKYLAGIRLANVDQSYQSLIESGGVTISRGDYHVDYFGVGPRVGIQGAKQFGPQKRVSLFANLHGTMLVGNYDVVFSNAPLPGLVYSQAESGIRTIPVMETELGLQVQAWNAWNLSTGWMFQSWWDLGTSGGTFGGLFAGADDSNIMAFDGWFLRAEYTY